MKRIVRRGTRHTQHGAESTGRRARSNYRGPAFAAKTYRLEVRASVYHNSAARIGTLPAELNVIA